MVNMLHIIRCPACWAYIVSTAIMSIVMVWYASHVL